MSGRLLFIGVDPGASKNVGRGGGLAVLDQDGRPVHTCLVPVKTYPIGTKQKTEVDAPLLHEIVTQVANRTGADHVFACVEHPPPTQRKFSDTDQEEYGERNKRNMGMRTPFSTGLLVHYGSIKAVLSIVCDQVVSCYPVTWKSSYKIGKNKEDALVVARRMFPEIDLRKASSHNVAEALLIATHGRMHFYAAMSDWVDGLNKRQSGDTRL